MRLKSRKKAVQFQYRDILVSLKWLNRIIVSGSWQHCELLFDERAEGLVYLALVISPSSETGSVTLARGRLRQCACILGAICLAMSFGF